MNSIKLKLVAICVAVVLIVMIISGSFMLLRVKTNETQKSMDQLKRYAQTINEQIVQVCDEPSQFNEVFAAREFLTQNAYDMQGCILNTLGQPIAPSEFRSLRVNDTSVVAAVAGEEGFSVGNRAKDINGTEQEWICYAVPAVKGDAHYVIFTRMSAKSMNDNLYQLTIAIIMMVVLALILTGGLWYLFANTLTGPIVALSRHAREMALGNLHKEIPVRGRDEIGQLTEDFNHMAKELNNTLSNMTSEKNKSEAILHNMTDGVLAYDAAGYIMHANSASSEMLQFDDIQSLTVTDILTRLGFNPEEVYSLASDTVSESTILVGDRYITACVTPYMNQLGQVDGFVIVLQDVTKHTKLDMMRKEFVANVSHELRTPLTSIKTYAETLLEGAVENPETAHDFLKVIDNEAQRMTLLVTDLLELSRLDNKQLSLDIEVLDLAGVVRQVILQNRVLAQKKNQQILFDPPNKPYFIEADAARINQVLSNILTNSIKYSSKNTNIEVTTEETERYFRVFIKDYGMGIPKEDQWRIFERFYRVDKARSRAMGGTGLGLAIAKEIMEEHGGRIFVSSELGSGTTMILRFVKYKEQD